MAEANVKARRVQIEKLINSFLGAKNDPQHERKLIAALKKIPEEELYDVLIGGYSTGIIDWIVNLLKKLLSWLYSLLWADNHTGHHNTMMHCAVKKGHSDVFNILLSVVAEDTAVKLLTVPNFLNGYSPLHHAVKNWDRKSIQDMQKKVCLGNWPKVLEAKDRQSITPLYMAIETKLENIIKEMLCGLESETIVKVLSLLNRQGLTAFQLAATKNNKSLLIKMTQCLSKAEVHELASTQTTGTLDTSMHLAAKFDCHRTIQFLFEKTPPAHHREMLDETNSKAQTALEIARSLNHKDAINAIEDHRDRLEEDEAGQGDIEGKPGAYGNRAMEGHANCMRDRLSFRNEVDNIDYNTPENPQCYPVELVAVPPARICHPEN